MEENGYISIVIGRKKCYHIFLDFEKPQKRKSVMTVFYCKYYAKKCFDILNGIFSQYYDQRERAYYITGGHIAGELISKVENNLVVEIMRQSKHIDEMVNDIEWELCRLPSYNSPPAPNLILINEIKRRYCILQEKIIEIPKEKTIEIPEEKIIEIPKEKIIIIKEIPKETIVYVRDNDDIEKYEKTKTELDRVKKMVINQENDLKKIEDLKRGFIAHMKEVEENYDCKITDLTLKNATFKKELYETTAISLKKKREHDISIKKMEEEFKKKDSCEKEKDDEFKKIKEECMEIKRKLDEKSREFDILKSIIKERDFDIQKLNQQYQQISKEKDDLIIDKAELRGQLKEKANQIDRFVETIQNMRKEMEVGEEKILKMEEENEILKKNLEKFKKLTEEPDENEKKLEEMRKKKQEIMAKLLE